MPSSQWPYVTQRFEGRYESSWTGMRRTLNVALRRALLRLRSTAVTCRDFGRAASAAMIALGTERVELISPSAGL